MATEVDICNLALGHLWESTKVSSINPSDGSRFANRCAAFYPIARDNALTAHDWSFARKSLAISLASDGHFSGPYTYQYTQPGDCLVPRKLYPSGLDHPDFPGLPFEVETTDSGDIIVTSTASAILQYTARVTDATRYPMGFVTALSWQLASFLAGPVVQNKSKSPTQAQAYQQYLYFLDNAKQVSNDTRKTADHALLDSYRPDYMNRVVS